MPSYDYALIRVVPHVPLASGETVGVILQCRQKRFIGVRWVQTPEVLGLRWPSLGVGLLARYLRAMDQMASGEGPLGVYPPSERFHWLTATRSTVIQPTAVHTGFDDDPEAALTRIAETLAP